MVQGWAELEELTRAVASEIGTASLDRPQLTRALNAMATVEKIAGSVVCLLAARFADESGPRLRRGGITEKVALRKVSMDAGIALDEARTTMALGRWMRSQPAVQEAALAGSLSRAQTVVVSQVVEADPDAAAYLLEVARHAPLSTLVRESRRARLGRPAMTDGGGQDGGALPGADPLTYIKPAGQDKPPGNLRTWVDAEGQWNLRCRGPRQNGITVVSALDLLIRRATSSRPAPLSGALRASAMAFDALVLMATSVVAAGQQQGAAEITPAATDPREAGLAACSRPTTGPARGHISPSATPSLIAGRYQNDYPSDALDWLRPAPLEASEQDEPP